MKWEFVVPGIPISVNAKGPGKKQWIATVREHATRNLPAEGFPIISDVAVSVVFFHVEDSLDVDNMLKRILDGIHPEVIADDSQVQDVSGSRRDISGTLSIRNPPAIILPHVIAGDPFVYVSIAEAMSQEELPWIGAEPSS
ncbi:RusA family crossover junction endodeoxyribonuclease [Kitasatospora sp. NPDC015120]|uniref:RusA family crossover junction endodeoxyribonuclease n=1 Tax=Kitasatospora sp. NPDC015120 TaxID=3364023 RepID=UPI0036F49FD7